jgi:hypothetical protein
VGVGELQEKPGRKFEPKGLLSLLSSPSSDFQISLSKRTRFQSKVILESELALFSFSC